MGKPSRFFGSVIVLAVISNGVFAASIPSGGGTVNGVDYAALDFSAWDSSLLSQDGGMQIFTDICGDLDVKVTAHGEFDAPTTYLATVNGGTNEIRSQHNATTGSGSSHSHGFTFEFSEPIDLIVNTFSLDQQEEYVIKGNSPTYSNVSGAQPLVSPTATDVTLRGVAFGLDPVTGAAEGNTFVNGTSSVMVTYTAFPTLYNKYGSMRLFKAVPVPEPGSCSMVAVAGLMLLGLRGRRRR